MVTQDVRARGNSIMSVEDPPVARVLFGDVRLVWIWLVLAWKTTGRLGLDRWVLPALDTPWSPGYIFQSGGGQQMAQRPSKA